MRDRKPFLSSSNQQPQKLSFRDCLKLASLQDFVIFFFGVLFAFINGAANALFGLVTGLALTTFDHRNTEEERNQLIYFVIFSYLLIGLCIFLGMIGSRTLLRINAQRQGYNFRKAYLKATLHQEISVFDSLNPTEFSSQLENDCKTINDALDSQIETIVWYLGGMTCSLVISFLRSWQIALIMFVAAPFMLLAIIFYGQTIFKGYIEKSASYREAGAIAEEAFTNIKTVVSLGGEKAEVQRYEGALSKAQPVLAKAGIYQGIALGSTQLIFSGIMAAVLFIGSFFIENETINPTTGKPYVIADIFTPLNAILLMFSQLSMIGPCIKGLTEAKIKARKILEITDRAKTNSSSNSVNPDSFGTITFKDVCFAYPNNPDKLVLQSLNFQIKANTKVGIVGRSGAGKSTIIQLLQKFYEPQSGKIELDEHDLKGLDPFWVRRNIAYVSQEPILFSMTIRENLLLGKEDATEDEILQALKKANAYDFVMDLENKLDTFVGGGVSAQLSGGQKQRIAIARAILRDAKVLLFDEVTSALDHMTEKEIQTTINNLSKYRTVIIVTHRLDALHDADQIVVLNQGKVEEIGKYETLLKQKGIFFELKANNTRTGVKKKNFLSGSNTEATLTDNKENTGDDENEEDLLLRKGKSNSSEAGSSLPNASPEIKQELSFDDLKRIWRLVKSHRKYFIFGVVGSLGVATSLPFIHVWISLAFAQTTDHLSPEFREKMNMSCLFTLLSGVLAFLFYIMEFGFFTKASEKVTQDLRVKVFYKFLRMHIGWHDDPKNSPGSLTTSLEVDVTSIGQVAGVSLGLIIQTILTNIIMVLIALVLCWQIGIIGAIIVPVLLSVAVKLNTNEAEGQRNAAQVLSKTEVLLSETINNMKTVTSLNAQDRFLSAYGAIIKQYHDIRLKTKIKNGILEGGLYLVLFWDLAGMYYLGTRLSTVLGISTFRIIFATFSVVITAMTSTQIFVLLPDVGKATNSIKGLFRNLDMKSDIDIEDKRACFKGKIQGNIEFRNVTFSYPMRGVRIFNNLSFKIDATDKHIGITGASGCGKSTFLQLLLRLYDVEEGEILIEGVNIKEYNLQYLRRKIGIVSQEPVLFYGSIEYNLKYNNKDISDLEMKKMVEKANALDFIEKDEDGFQRIVGAKGGQLSVGQKQRIAIARALLRQPSILLLDEATSSLDAENENIVQEALTNIAKELTSITVAHRLETLKEVDNILVFRNGEIIERGKYDQLIQNSSYFYQLKQALHE